jgi:hypothetical protein
LEIGYNLLRIGQRLSGGALICESRRDSQAARSYSGRPAVSFTPFSAMLPVKVGEWPLRRKYAAQQYPSEGPKSALSGSSVAKSRASAFAPNRPSSAAPINDGVGWIANLWRK